VEVAIVVAVVARGEPWSWVLILENCSCSSVHIGMDKDTTTFLSVPEVARQLRVKAITVRRWIQDGILEAESIQEGKRHRYRILKHTVDMLKANPK